MIFFLSFLLLTHFCKGKLLDEFLKGGEKGINFTIITNSYMNDTYSYHLSVESLKWGYGVVKDQWATWKHDLLCSYYYVIPKINETNPHTSSVVLRLSNDETDNKRISKETNSISCSLNNLPPKMKLEGEKNNGEEEILAILLNKFLKSDFKNTNDTKYLMHFYTTKVIYIAMNIIDDVIKFNDSIKYEYVLSGDRFFRGYSTYLISSVDPKNRVKAIIPQLVDINLQSFFLNTYSQFCFWPDSMKEFEKREIFYKLKDDLFVEFQNNVDPIKYDLGTVAKFILLSTGDELFSNFHVKTYFHMLKGLKYISYIPNIGNGISDVNSIIINFVNMFRMQNLPSFTWDHSSHEKGTVMNVRFEDFPSSVIMYSSENKKNYDFRYSAVKQWDEHDDIYTLQKNISTLVEKEKRGWKAAFVRMTYGNVHFTTDMLTVPTNYPCGEPPKNIFKEVIVWIVLSVLGMIIGVFIVCSIILFILYSFYSSVIRKLFKKTEDIYVSIDKKVTGMDEENIKVDEEEISSQTSSQLILSVSTKDMGEEEKEIEEKEEEKVEKEEKKEEKKKEEVKEPEEKEEIAEEVKESKDVEKELEIEEKFELKISDEEKEDEKENEINKEEVEKQIVSEEEILKM